MNTLSNQSYHFVCYPEEGRFSVESSLFRKPVRVDRASLEVNYRYRGRSYKSLNQAWTLSMEDAFEGEDAQLGKMQQLSLLLSPDERGISYQISFGLPERYPFFTWKVLIRNNGSHPVWIDQIDMLRVGEKAQGGARSDRGMLDLGNAPSKKEKGLAFFSNGWQSWSYTAAYGQAETPRYSRLGNLQSSMMINKGTPVSKKAGYHSSDFFGAVGNRNTGKAILAGFLSQHQHFGSIEAWIKGTPSLAVWANGDGMRLDPGEKVETDWAVIYPFSLDQLDPLAPFYDAVAQINGVSIREEIPSGWCSWYQYYQKVTGEQVWDNLLAVADLQKQLPLELVQIDDGFESQVGDWLEFKDTFPGGVEPLAREISKNGLTPGLWLAPFIVHTKSKLFKEHPDYILRDKKGRPVQAGLIWNNATTALDLTHPGALNYAWCVVEKAVKEWGFPYLKLDFLYAGALAGQHRDPTKTRAQILRSSFQALRKAVGQDTYLLGCGAPLGSSLGIFDAMRVSADVNGAWKPSYAGVQPFFKKEPNIPAAENAIQNTITRAAMHKRWWINDPDCLLVRPDTKLTLAEVQSLASVISVTGGSLLLSDDLTALPEDRLRIAKVLLPLIGKRPTVIDWFDRVTPKYLRLDLEGAVGKWHLLAFFNWEDKEAETTIWAEDYNLPGGKYWARSFWDGITYPVKEGHPIAHRTISPHGVVLFAVRERIEDKPQYIGSSLHISQGLEIVDWKESSRSLKLKIDLQRDYEGLFELYLPETLHAVMMNGKRLHWRVVGENQYQILVQGDQPGQIEVNFE